MFTEHICVANNSLSKTLQFSVRVYYKSVKITTGTSHQSILHLTTSVIRSVAVLNEYCNFCYPWSFFQCPSVVDLKNIFNGFKEIKNQQIKLKQVTIMLYCIVANITFNAVPHAATGISNFDMGSKACMQEVNPTKNSLVLVLL